MLGARPLSARRVLEAFHVRSAADGYHELSYLMDDETDGELWPMQEDIVGMLRSPCAAVKEGDVT